MIKTTTLAKVLAFINTSTGLNAGVNSAATQRLIVIADEALASRQGDTLRVVSDLLQELELPKMFGEVCQFYRAVAIQDFSKGNGVDAMRLLERVAERGPLAYRARALTTAGTILARWGKGGEALDCYCESLKMSRSVKDPYVALGAQCNIASMLAMNGDHKASLRLLEKIAPSMQLIKRRMPEFFLSFLNCLACEKAEAGEFEEASMLISIPLRSPFAPAFPEWRESRGEIAEGRFQKVRRRLFARPANVIRLVPRQDSSSPPDTPARVLPYRERGSDQSYDLIDLKEQALTIIHSRESDYESLARMLKAGLEALGLNGGMISVANTHSLSRYTLELVSQFVSDPTDILNVRVQLASIVHDKYVSARVLSQMLSAARDERLIS